MTWDQITAALRHLRQIATALDRLDADIEALARSAVGCHADQQKPGPDALERVGATHIAEKKTLTSGPPIGSTSQLEGEPPCAWTATADVP